MAAALGLGLAAATSLASCFEQGERWYGDAGAPAVTTATTCTVGDVLCAGNTLERCAEGANGPAGTPVEDCAAKGQVCVPSLSACAACPPGQIACDGSNVTTCRLDGSRTDVTQACDPGKGEACRSGGCVNLCLQAAQERSNVGCEYWGADLDNADISATENADAQQYAIVVSNAQPDVPVSVQVFQDDSLPGQSPAPYEIARATIAARNLQVFKLGPREVDGSPPGQYNTGTKTALTRRAFKVVASFPVVAYQFNPLDNVNVFSNDASLLKPREALTFDTAGLGPEYVVAGWPQTIAVTDDPNTNFDPSSPINLRATLTILGTRAGTHVRVHTTTGVIAGGPVPATAAGGIIDATIDPFDVLNLETGGFNADFTGSIIESDGPIAVFSGSQASDAPHFLTLSDRRCCADHLENQLDPIRTNGKTFAIAHTPSRTRANVEAGALIGVVPEPDFVRFVASTTMGATITTTLPPPDDQIFLGFMGDFREVTAYRDFMATSSQPIVVERVMASQDACGVPRGLPGGDPSLLIEPPIEQFRGSYVFLVPDKYAFNFVTIVAPIAAHVTLDDTALSAFPCDGPTPADGLTTAERGGKAPPLVVYRCAFDFPIINPHLPAPANLNYGARNDGVHVLLSDEAIGAIVTGFDSYVSYDYAAGTDLHEISIPK